MIAALLWLASEAAIVVGVVLATDDHVAQVLLVVGLLVYPYVAAAHEREVHERKHHR